MSKRDRQRWDARYSTPEWCGISAPSPLVMQYATGGGRALDVACGQGQNTLWLAAHGYYAVGLDISGVALRSAASEARARQLQGHVDFVQADLDRFCLPPASLDLVCVMRFLHRPLFPALWRALRSGGRLIYSTLNWRRLETHPDTDPDYLLQSGELLAAFEGLEILTHAENGDMTDYVGRVT